MIHRTMSSAPSIDRPWRRLVPAALAACCLTLALAASALAQKGGYTFGALLPLTGPLADRGKTSKAALDLAVKDINDYLSASGAGGQASILIEDTGGDPKTAADKLKALAAKGVKVVIGPYTDAETEVCLEFADKNNVLLLSQGSASPALAKKGDNLFRFSPSDTYQAEAVTSLIRQEGVAALVPLWRGDHYGDELVVHVKARFKQLGGEALPGTRFAPDRKDFGPILDDLAKQVGTVRAKQPNAKVAVYFAGGDEVVPLLKAAAKHPGLAGLAWYGCDATAMNDAIAKDEESAAFAMKVRFISPRFGEGGANVYSQVEKRIQDKTDLFPDTQSAVAYDEAWVALFAALPLGSATDFARLKQAIPAVAERMYGVTGWLALNDYGDRREDWDFDFWVLKHEEGKYFWEKAARYQFEPGTAKELYITNEK